jgi:hypothetical protein
MMPTAYELKRLLREDCRRRWCADELAGIAIAPVYLFPDQARFDADEIDAMARALHVGPPRLPHDEVLFEVTDRGPQLASIVAYVTARDGDVDGFLFLRERCARRWSDVMCRARFLENCVAEIEPHPSRASEEQPDAYASVLTGLVWRALAWLSQGATVRSEAVPATRRPKLARRGVSGWEYRIVKIDPARAAAVARAQGGTHASPRWHIRRGHFRTLADGRRTFVRACAVGDAASGGVVKDYCVRPGPSS